MGDKMEPKTSIREKSSVVIRGVTFYKAEEEGHIEEEEEATFKRKEKSSWKIKNNNVMIQKHLCSFETSFEVLDIGQYFILVNIGQI